METTAVQAPSFLSVCTSCNMISKSSFVYERQCKTTGDGKSSFSASVSKNLSDLQCVISRHDPKVKVGPPWSELGSHSVDRASRWGHYCGAFGFLCELMLACFGERNLLCVASVFCLCNCTLRGLASAKDLLPSVSVPVWTQPGLTQGIPVSPT